MDTAGRGQEVGDLQVANVACRLPTCEHGSELGDDPEAGIVVEAGVEHLACHALAAFGDDHLVDLVLVDQLGEIVDRAQHR